MSQRTDRVGPYHIIRRLGEGGMGTVYLAEQETPIRRQVALKVLKDGDRSEEVLRRFEAERQALAVMDHPSIARIFDAGRTEDGRSFFAMEYVDGSPISEYCDSNRLSVDERVRLYVEVCRAVQHAHQKGVIHRDLKPPNVLVSKEDGAPRPRIIDFGVAKATEQASFDGTRLTVEDSTIGTPAYMSPEQLTGSRDVDTRADIYALGVLLYQLLAGVLPFQDSAYRGWAAMAATLYRDPPSMARRFGSLEPPSQARLAGQRATTTPELLRALRGDLGWIVEKAMTKDREQRYETANALALDLTRHLTDHPVRAKGAATAYVVGKFVRRNRVYVSFALLAVLGLAGFSITTAVQSERVARARDEAETRRDQAEGLIDFMLSDLRAKLEPVGQIDILDDVGTEAVRYFASLPEERFTDEELDSRAQSLYQIGRVRIDQGDYPAAVEAIGESLRLAQALVARRPGDADLLFGLSQSHFYAGYASYVDGDLDGAEAQFREYLRVAEELVALDPDNVDYQLELGFAHGNLGSVYEARGNLESAVASFSSTLGPKRAKVEQDPTDVQALGELSEAHNKIGVVNRKLGRYEAAAAEHERELEIKRRILGLEPQHAYWRHRSAVALGFLAEVRRSTGQLPEALELYREELAVMDSLVAFDPANTRWRRDRALILERRGAALVAAGRPAEALPLLEKSRMELTELLRTDSSSFGWNVDLAGTLTTLAELELAEGRTERALGYAETAVVLTEGEAEPTSGAAQRVARAYLVRGQSLAVQGRPGPAREDRLRALEVIEPFLLGQGRAEFRPLYAEILHALDRTEEARVEVAELDRSGFADPYFLRLLVARNGG